MDNDNYRFKLGDFQCMAVSDGTMTYAPPNFPPPSSFLFANAPGNLLEEELFKHDLDPGKWSEWVSTYTCLIIDTGDHRLLIDTGAGSLTPSTGKLLHNLQAAGIAPEDIDIVVITHGHPDHVGGNLDIQGNPVFTRARWLISRKEWTFWTSEQAEHQLDEHSRELLINIARRNLLPLRDRMELIDDETEIVPGIRSILAPGHTPGMMIVTVASQGDSLLYISDAFIHPVHVTQTGWYATVDVFPEQVNETRLRLLNSIALGKSLIMAFHFPFPGLGYMEQKDQVWQWRGVL